MRDLKFRVWDADNNWYMEEELTKLLFKSGGEPDIIYDGELWLAPNNVIVEQFTGIKDILGRNIYEGDIVEEAYKAPYNGGIHGRGESFEVKYGNYVLGKWLAKDVLKNSFGINGYLFGSEIFRLGNIHENADLLEKK